MIMDIKCPYCGSENIIDLNMEIEWSNEDEAVNNGYATCDDCNEVFRISEIIKVTSRLVAKDHDDMERLIDEEDKEYMAKKKEE